MLKVVVMDNNAISRDLLKSLLAVGGHEIAGDTNISPTGVAKAILLKPQIVCVDIGEDLKAGGALLKQLRTELPKALVFVVSGKMSPEGVKNAIQYGVHGFIVKPFNSATVLATIRAAVLKLVKSQQAARSAASEEAADSE